MHCKSHHLFPTELNLPKKQKNLSYVHMTVSLSQEPPGVLVIKGRQNKHKCSLTVTTLYRIRLLDSSCYFVQPSGSGGSDLGDASSSEGHDDGDHIDGELELQELGDAVIDVPAPHHGLHDAAEVVVCQDDVRSLLRHIRTCDALQNTVCKITYINLSLGLDQV